MRARALAVLALVAASSPATYGQSRDHDAGFDADRTRWKEIEASLPLYPRPENLIQFEAGAASRHRFFIDAASLTVGEDGVVRYTLVVKAAGGASNVSFEGIRCETREQKYYALGRVDGTWARVREPQWRRIENREVNRQHHALHADFFCPGTLSAAAPKQAIDALRRASAGLR